MEISESLSIPEKSAERLAPEGSAAELDFDSTGMAETNSLPTHQQLGPDLNTSKETTDQNTDSNNPDLNSETCERTDDEWLDIMGSGNFKKKVLKPGLGSHTRPNRGDQVTVDVAYSLNNTLLEENTDFKFIVGDLDVIQGLDLAICLMEKGEKAKIQIPSTLAYGTQGLSPNVPPNTDLEYDVELKDVQPLEEESLSVSLRLKIGDEKRIRGNFYYERGQHLEATHCYQRSSAYLDGLQASPDSSPEDLQKIVDLRIKVYNNMAASQMKLESYSSALQSVESVLRVQPENVKALFRKGKVLGLQGQTDEAIVCMRNAANLDPQTKAIQIALARLKCQKKREELSQKEMYKRMFKSETSKPKDAAPWIRKWSMISCGVLAVAIGTAVAYRQYH